jgi:hypothetical protein
MLLIYPPASRSAEPPLGIARLAGILRAAGLAARCLDLCQEGIEYLLGLETESLPDVEGAWVRGALRRRERNLDLIRGGGAFSSLDRYRRAVLDLNRALKAASAGSGVEASLADYRDPELSPLRREDLLASAASCEDNVFFPLFSRRIESELDAFPARAIGVSICFLSQALCAFAIVGYVKKAHPGLRILLGGGLVTSWVAQGALATQDRFDGLVDAVLPGRGEEGLIPALRELGAVEARYDRGLARGALQAAPDFSDYSSLRYLSPVRIVPYNFSTGCPWSRCSFCPEKAERSRYTGLRVGEAMRQVHEVAARSAPGLVHFTDSEIAPLYLRALVDTPPGPRWYGFARFSNILADPSFCERLAASGCAMLQLGLESGDQRVLDALGKGTRLAQIDRVLECLAAAGIGAYLYVLFGTPAEDRDAALRTRDFIAERSDRIDFLNVAIFNLPASSEEADTLETKPFYEGELSLYREFRHPAGWDRGAVRAFLAREFEAEPSIRAILARNPPVFTSSHAALFPRPR